ncbi:MAG: hypothetical protein L0219_12585, partial [Phycisphaerales bacterium]|nr:hypothetical protein [Phycisphaerales bacterium]
MFPQKRTVRRADQLQAASRMRAAPLGLIALTLCVFVGEANASGVDVVSGDPKDWPMYNHDSEGTRCNTAENILGPNTVAGLEVLWS